jgi:hypothetical protein
MAYTSTRLGCPDAERNRERAAQQDTVADPSSLNGKFKERYQCQKRKDSRSIGHWGGGLGPAAVFAERRFPRRVHPGVYCAIDKRFPGRFPGLHDEGHCPDAEQNGKKARSQGSVTSKEEA